MGHKTRFAIVFGVALLLFLAAFSTVVYYHVQARLKVAAYAELERYLEHEWRHLVEHHGHGDHGSQTLINEDFKYRIWRNGRLIFDSFPAEDENATLGSLQGQGRVAEKMEMDFNGSRYELLGFYDMHAAQAYLADLRWILIFGSLVAIFIVGPLSYWLASRLLAPFRTLSRTTARLDAKSLSFRYEEPRLSDEYGQLVRNFNSLLDRLEKSFIQLRRFATNASHELRTPITVLRGEAELLLKKQRTPQEYQAGLTTILRQAESLQKIVSQLLFLSDLERMGQEPKRQNILVKEAIAETIAALKRVHSDHSAEIQVFGDEEAVLVSHTELFSSVVNNLVENAIKYSNGIIRLNFSKDASGLRLSVEDNGLGIAEKEREDVFQAFAKAKGPRKDGHGLGLSIVKACVQALKGSISLRQSPLGGLGVDVYLPG